MAAPALTTRLSSTGPLLMLVAVGCIALDTLLVRLVSSHIHPLEIVFFRSLFGLVAVVPHLLRHKLRGIATGRLPMHTVRAAFKIAGLVLLFAAIARLPLALVTVIAFTTPLFICLGSVLFLGERLRTPRVVALVLGFVGVLVAVRPGVAPMDLGIVMAIGSALVIAGVMLIMKFLSVREPPPTVVSINLLLMLPLTLPFMAFVWVTPSPEALGLLFLSGALSGVAQLSASTAMSMTDVSILAPIDFLRLPMVALLAWTFLGETTDLATVLGGTMIFAGTLGLILGERRHPVEPV